MRHPKLGELQWADEGWWEGEAPVKGGELPFAVKGDKRGPDQELVTALSATLSKWPELLKKTKVFLTSSDFGHAVDGVAMLAIVFLSTPQHFAIDFMHEDDEEAVWKLEFENGEPKQLSRDD
jgi:hypothetical protein